MKEVRVEGNRRVEADAVKAVLSEKAGRPLDPKKVQADVRAVMKLGYFSDVVVEARGPRSAPILVYRVTEKPAVQSTRIEGNEELSNDDLKDLVEVKPGSILDEQAIRKSVKKIQEKYVEKGFYLAEVTHRVEPKPENQVEIVFVVDEHAKVQVKSIRIIGNERVPADELKPFMQTQEGGYLSFIFSSGTYREEAFQRDLQAIQAVYLDRGFVNVKVGKPAISLSPDKRFLYATVHVEEGEQFTIGKIDFSGELLDKRPELEKLLQSKPGDLFSRSKVGHDLFGIGDVYKDMGYAYANVNPLTNVDPKARTVDLTFEVQPGQKVYFEKIEIAGNLKTRDKVIRRELRIYEGELFSATGVKTSKARVTALGYFETVEITTKKGSADDKIVATVEVKERATGTFQIGAGFSSYENFILTGQIAQQNLFGWGQTLSLQVQYSSIRQLGQIQFVEPYFFDTRWTFAFDLYATEGFYTNFTRKAIGGSMTWGYELSGLSWLWPWAQRLEDMRIFATYTNEYVTVTPNLAIGPPLFNAFKSGTTSSLRLSWQWDKRDNRLFPTAGFFQSASAEFAPPFLAPEGIFGHQLNLFTRYTLDSRWYKPIIWGFVGKLKVTAGYIKSWFEGDVPISERYFLGGINSVRGYRLLDLAPRAFQSDRPDSPTHTIAIGGDKQLIFNFELEFPLFDKVGIRGVVFFDAGNAFARGSFSDPSVPLSLYKSWGFGLRWFSPLGPLRFEWGIPIDRRRDPITGVYLDNAIDFQFTIGSFF